MRKQVIPEHYNQDYRMAQISSAGFAERYKFLNRMMCKCS